MTQPTPTAGDPIEVVPVVIRNDAGEAADAQAAVAPTQLRRPWRSTARTVFQATVSLAIAWPIIVQVLGLPDWAWVTASLAGVAGFTRLMATPVVEAWLRTYLPWLAAAPAPQER